MIDLPPTEGTIMNTHPFVVFSADKESMGTTRAVVKCSDEAEADSWAAQFNLEAKGYRVYWVEKR
jgi:hypothetical protein